MSAWRLFARSGLSILSTTRIKTFSSSSAGCRFFPSTLHHGAIGHRRRHASSTAYQKGPKEILFRCLGHLLIIVHVSDDGRTVITRQTSHNSSRRTNE